MTLATFINPMLVMVFFRIRCPSRRRKSSRTTQTQQARPRDPGRYVSWLRVEKILIPWNIGYTLWLFNIAMENGPFIDGLPIKNGDFPWLWYHISTVGWAKNLSRDTTCGTLFLQGIQLNLKGEGVNFWLYTVCGEYCLYVRLPQGVAMKGMRLHDDYWRLWQTLLINLLVLSNREWGNWMELDDCSWSLWIIPAFPTKHQ